MRAPSAVPAPGRRRWRGGNLPLRPFLTAEWRDLLMLNYEADPAALAPLVPRGTELDTHQGCTYLSLVALRFRRTRILGLSIPLHRNFEELNLRFYVGRVVGEEVRRGVVFVREVVPRRAVAAVARVVYHEPYVALPMRSAVRGQPPAVHYAWRLDGRWHTLEAQAVGAASAPAPGSREALITEHHWGYTRRRDGGTLEYRVDHPRWRVWRAVSLHVEADFESLYGPRLAAALTRPASALIAEGSEVAVYRPERASSTRVRIE